MTVIDQLGSLGIVPVVVIRDEGNAVPLAEALIAGGLPVMEVTFRTGAAGNAITRIAKEAPSVLLGAGTVLSVDQVKTALDCGARYIVSPGLNRAVVEHCLKNAILVIPGALTPTELGLAHELGLNAVKFFPAEAAGGLGYLKAVSAPFGKMRFIPTGGIDATNLASYLRFHRVIACGGSWMAGADLVDGKRFDEITRLSAQAVQLMKTARAL